MKPQPLIMSFLPLVAFSLLSQLLPHGAIGYAALVAAIFALLSILIHRPYWPPKILNATSLVLFVVLAVAGFAGRAGTDRWLAIWARAGGWPSPGSAFPGCWPRSSTSTAPATACLTCCSAPPYLS